jgi:formylglycine-generating enzyme
MKTKLGLLLLMLLIAVGCGDSTHSGETAEIAELQEQVENLQKIAAEEADAEKADAEIAKRLEQVENLQKSAAENAAAETANLQEQVEHLQKLAAAEKAVAIKAALSKGNWRAVLALDPDNSEGLRMKDAAPKFNSLDMTFNKIAADTFQMGSRETEIMRQHDEHEHWVRISKAFYMQTTEVTQGQWKELMGTRPWEGKSDVKEGYDYPATYVNWYDAVAYCKKLSAKEGKTYRLPTEAEWEYACRAGTNTVWSFGYDEKELRDYAWYDKNALDIDEKYAHQVGLKKPNAFGLYDMHGNVYEWCSDYFGDDYYKRSPKQELLVSRDPQGPRNEGYYTTISPQTFKVVKASGSFRVLRGGSYVSLERHTRSANRSRNVAVYRLSNYGFRLVRELD